MNSFFTRKGINLDITHQCTLGCPGCARAYYNNKKIKVPGRDLTLKELEIILDFYDHINICGQISDPLLHPQFKEIMNRIHTRKKEVVVHTAVSHNSKEFYIECFKSNPNATWIFGIDGLPQHSHNYRIRQDGKFLFDMMLLSKEYVKSSVWQYIVFNYNENDIVAAQDLAKQNDLEFLLVYSNRWKSDNVSKAR